MLSAPLSRRRFLTAVVRAGAGAAALAALPPLARAACAAAAPAPDLIERNVWPEHWETSLAALDRSAITPNELFFVRSHFGVPAMDALLWPLEIAGRVRTPLSLSVAELKRMPAVTWSATLECAGNGRGLYPVASTAGTQWEYGAVGTARWTGVRLADLLERAGVEPDAGHAWFEAADRAAFGTAPPFLRSAPLEKASRDVLIAWAMNDAPLPARHGGPLRAIVPGWYGAASTKWLKRVRLEAQPSDNHFMAKGYRWVYPGDDPATAPSVERMRVKSIITTPREGTVARAGTLKVAGFAWSGERGIARVEVAAGGAWREARLLAAESPHAWRRWEAEVALPAGAEVEIAARATDDAGETQPDAARINAGGYGNNSIQRVRVRGRA